MSNNNIRNKILFEPVSYEELLSIHRLRISGIYKIENTINHKVYIGQSKDVIKRILAHLRHEDNPHFKKAFEKYGKNNFSFEIIKETYDRNYWEIFLIQIYHSANRNYGYNILSGGEGGNSEVTRKREDPETRKKISESQKQVIHTPEWNKKVSEAQKCKTISEETKQKSVRNVNYRHQCQKRVNRNSRNP